MLINTLPSVDLEVYEKDEVCDGGYHSDGWTNSAPSSPGPYSPDSIPSSPDLFSPDVAQTTIFCYPPAYTPVYRPIFYLVIPQPQIEYSYQKLEEEYSVGSGNRILNIPISRLVKWSLPPPVIPQVELPFWAPMPYGMENFWQSAFAHLFLPLFTEEGETWSFHPVSAPPFSDPTKEPWHTCSYTSKVRFTCPRKHGFTMLKGRVNFYYRKRRQGEQILREVVFLTFGAQCNRCPSRFYPDENPFLQPLFYFEEIENAVRYLLAEVRHTYYGGEKLPPPPRIRQGRSKPGRHHDVDRCQACHFGVCVIRR